MKCFVIIICFVFLKLCAADLSANVSKSLYDELEQRHLQVLLENGQFEKKIANLKIENVQYQKTIADLKIENANLKVELYGTREKNNNLTERLDLKHFNFSGLSNEAEYLSQNLKILTDDVKLFNSYFDQQFANYKKEFGDTTKNTEVEEIICLPKKFFGLKFIDQTLYEKVCDVKKSNGEWTVIQRRMDGSENFYRGWADYKVGFGTITGEFFIGLDSLHLLTTCAPQELRIEMEDQDQEKRYAMYDSFVIGDESEKYAMKQLGSYSGNAGDSLDYHRSQMFSTFDQDNDIWAVGNCAKRYKGAWWHGVCHYSNLNGEYGNNHQEEGINWYHWHGYHYSLKKVEMKIRPKN